MKKVYVIISTVDHNAFYSIVGVFHDKEKAVKYIYDNGKYKQYYEDWDIIESELYPATNIL